MDELEAILTSFGGRSSHTRCFLHTINLVAKSLLRVFDKPKHSGRLDDETADGGTGAEEGCADNVDGWVDEVNDADAAERVSFERRAQPAQLVLSKVRRFLTTHHG